jgi:hypothetical protein
MNGNNLSKVRREVRRKFRNRERKHLDDKINDVATHRSRRTLETLSEEREVGSACRFPHHFEYVQELLPSAI